MPCWNFDKLPKTAGSYTNLKRLQALMRSRSLKVRCRTAILSLELWNCRHGNFRARTRQRSASHFPNFGRGP
jgi:hypothetical protein